jgi:hypothetical protein
MYKRSIISVLSFIIAASTLLVHAVEPAPIENDMFQKGPSSTQVHAWWHWISGNVTKDGITKDLESMKERGISQVTILNIGSYVTVRLDMPDIKFNSPEWYGMFRFALTEAKRLGMTVGVHNCDGWSTSGGPWVSPEQSMKEVVWSKVNVTGGKRISVQLRVGDILKEKNTLEVSLQTVCRNRILGDLREFGDVKTIWTTAPIVQQKLLKKEMALKPTGLLGPVRLVLDQRGEK